MANINIYVATFLAVALGVLPRNVNNLEVGGLLNGVGGSGGTSGIGGGAGGATSGLLGGGGHEKGKKSDHDNWSEIETQQHELDNVMSNTINKIRKASHDEISDKLDAVSTTVKILMTEMKSLSLKMKLTRLTAKEITKGLDLIFMGLQTDIKDTVATFSQTDQDKITEAFEECHKKILEIGQEIRKSLKSQYAFSDWSLIQQKMSDLKKTLKTDLIESLRQDANSTDDASVTKSISNKLDAAVSRFKSIFSEAQSKIKSHSLTKEKVEEVFGSLKDVVKKLEKDLKNDVSNLSDASKNHVESTFQTTLKRMEDIKRDIYDA